MSNNKTGDDKMITAAVEEVIGDRSQVLSLHAVHGYTDELVERGHAEYNKGSILVKSQHPLDQCLRRGIIEQEHHDIGKRLRNYRDCAVSKSVGRVYNATGEGDSEMDAGTIYANALRYMNGNVSRKGQWKLISIICFAEPDINGVYMSEADYAMLCQLAPNIKHAFESADVAFTAARKTLRDKLDAEKKEDEARLRS